MLTTRFVPSLATPQQFGTKQRVHKFRLPEDFPDASIKTVRTGGAVAVGDIFVREGGPRYRVASVNPVLYDHTTATGQSAFANEVTLELLSN